MTAMSKSDFVTHGRTDLLDETGNHTARGIGGYYLVHVSLDCPLVVIRQCKYNSNYLVFD